MAELFGGIDYQRLAKAMGRANRAERVTVDLNVVHAGFPEVISLLASNGQRVTILATAGVWALTVIFQDGSNITLTSAELAAGDILDWDFVYLYVTNAAQPGLTLTLIVDSRVITGVEGY